MVCKCICGKEFKNKYSLGGHRPHCKIYMNSIGKEPVKSNFTNRHMTPWNKGLTKENNEKLKLMSNKISKSLLGKGHPQSEETKKKISEKCKKNGGGYRPGSGYGKQGWYKGIWCDSSYELAFVIYNIEHNINFKRNYDRFDYVYENKCHKYTPDFELNNQYIEIKGFERSNDKIKYKSCPNLKIMYYDDLKYCFDYVINKYGKDYIKLYKESMSAATDTLP